MSGVLFDEPGPRARRRTRIATAVTVVAVLALLAAVVQRLASTGQLDLDLWAPMLDPSAEEFGPVWDIIGSGLGVTLRAFVVAAAASLVLGVTVAAVRLSLGRTARLPLVAAVELFRGLPVVVTIFLAGEVLRLVDSGISTFWALVLGLTAYNSVIIAEIVRAGVVALPKGQAEAGLAIGLTPGQVMRSIQLPQALRAMLPAVISQLVVVLKDTALASIVFNDVQDLLYAANRLRLVLDNSLQAFVLIAVIYIVLCVLLDRAAVWTERRLSRARPSTAGAVAPAEEAVTRV
ncbi:amino acid ABC transporter permease [Quadrisphaera sp. INWT6]|uniref:amino acid ABC transporter permease n=1 Tax=Quadrisphaera sp. INWT6 TaxID=2596917 RepID=UPI0018925F43|nr:amino acid ABC transporter permease [Quadrisphaera sp. INWT6]MBF5082061.1 amino acid ABC transporter permease [Quadrisphaera sp. INWT6]